MDEKLKQVREYFRDDGDEAEAEAEADTSGTSVAEAELFVREIESITSRLDSSESARWIREIKGVTVTGSFSAGRCAIDHDFRAVIDNALGREQPTGYREALSLYLDTFARLLLDEELGAQTWFDLQRAFATYFELSMTIGSHSDESDKLCHRVIGDMLKKSLVKRRPDIPDFGQLMALRDVFPNLDEPIRWAAEHLATRKAKGDSGFSLPPILLVGPPGIGKTYLAYELSRLIDALPRTINMGSVTHAFVLSGTDRKWGQSAPGVIVKTMIDAEQKTPVIVLDEIDKADNRFGNVLAPLYHLLDPVMAPRFTDEFLGFEIDTSSITWIATANEKSQIPEPLIDRFQCFDVPPPSKQQLSVIVQSMYRGMRGQIAYLPEEIPAAWLKHLEGASLREVGRELQRAIGRVALAKEMDTGGDVDLDSATVMPAKRRKMGF